MAQKPKRRTKKAKVNLFPDGTASVQDYFDFATALGLRESPPSFKDFCRFVRVPNQVLGGEPVFMAYENWFPEQQLFEQNRTGQDVILKGRQIGMTTLETVRSLFFALTHPDSRTKIIAQDQPTAKKILRDLQDFYSLLTEYFPRFQNELLPPVGSNKITANSSEIRFINNASISAMQAGTNLQQAAKGRGGKVDRLHLSEVAFWPLPQETMRTAMGACHPKTEIVYESTPQSLGDWFYSLCQQTKLKQNSMKFHFFNWLIHPTHKIDLTEWDDVEALRTPLNSHEERLLEMGCTPEQMKFWRNKVSATSLTAMQAEHPVDPESCFVAAGGMFIDTETRAWLQDNVKEPLFLDSNNVRINQEVHPGRKYVLGCDAAEGIGADCTSFVVIDQKTLAVVASWSSNITSPEEAAQIIKDTAEEYNKALVVVEEASGGKVILNRLSNMGYYNLYKGLHQGSAKTPGSWFTSSKTRPFIFSAIREVMKERTAVFSSECGFDQQLFAELCTMTGGARPQAANKGAHSTANKLSDAINSGIYDDMVIAYGIALAVRNEIYQPNAWDFGLFTSIHQIDQNQQSAHNRLYSNYPKEIKSKSSGARTFRKNMTL